MTTFTLRGANAAKTGADTLVVGLQQKAGKRGNPGDGVELAPGAEDVAAAYGRKLRPLLAALGAKATVGEVIRVPTAGTISSPMLVFVGLGPSASLSHDVVRRAAGAAARAITNAASVALALPADAPDLVRAAVEGYGLGSYTYTEFKSKSSEDQPGTVTVLSSAARRQEVIEEFKVAEVIVQTVAATRDWVNRPPGDLRPPAFATSVVEQAKATSKVVGKDGTRVSAKVFDEVALAEMGAGGLIGVGRASSAPPRLVELTYRPKGAKTHIALVGKGITFDSGGLSIKPAAGMTTMKCDMAGAAAVVQATLAIAQLGLPVQVTCYAPMAENMVSGESTRPGDVLSIYGGKTVEVLNTDAEGRLILADALVRASQQKPDVILDVATLTGAMVVALGERIGGVLGNDEVVGEVVAAGKAAGEAHWPMPLTEDITERVKSSKIADLAQTDMVRWGGGLFAGAFLQEFTDGIDWAHLDIAGPAFNGGGAHGYVTPGGTGFAVATLVEFARARAK